MIEKEKRKLSMCLSALNYIEKFLDNEAVRSGESFWEGKNGMYIRTDMGYFEDGIEQLQKNILKKLGCEEPEPGCKDVEIRTIGELRRYISDFSSETKTVGVGGGPITLSTYVHDRDKIFFE